MNNQEIKVIARGVFKKDCMEKAIILYERLIFATRKEEGCISYDLYQNAKDPAVLTMIETWESQTHLDAHMKTEHFTTIVPLLGTLRESSEIETYTKII